MAAAHRTLFQLYNINKYHNLLRLSGSYRTLSSIAIQVKCHKIFKSVPTLLAKPQHEILCLNQPLRLLSDGNRENVASRLLECIKQYDKLTSAQLTLESRFKEDLSMDSLDHVEMIMLIEDEFGFEIPDAAAEKMETPAKILEYVLEKVELDG